jgi:hypothetical protein
MACIVFVWPFLRRAERLDWSQIARYTCLSKLNCSALLASAVPGAGAGGVCPPLPPTTSTAAAAAAAAAASGGAPHPRHLSLITCACATTTCQVLAVAGRGARRGPWGGLFLFRFGLDPPPPQSHSPLAPLLHLMAGAVTGWATRLGLASGSGWFIVEWVWVGLMLFKMIYSTNCGLFPSFGLYVKILNQYELMVYDDRGLGGWLFSWCRGASGFEP